MTPRAIYEDGFSNGVAFMCDGPKGRNTPEFWEGSETRREADRIASDLAKLDSPVPGMRIEGDGWHAIFEPGPCFNPDRPSWEHFWNPEQTRYGTEFYHASHLAILKQAVKGGARVVMPEKMAADPNVEKGAR